MEVIEGGEDQCFALRHVLHLVSPLPRNLDGSLYSLCAGVHGQRHVIAKHLLHLLGPDGEDIVVECARGQGQTAGLLGQGLDQFWVAMALVDSAVGGEEVNVMLAFGIPDIDTLSAGEDDRERMVVVGSELVLGGDRGLGRGGVKVGVHSGSGSAIDGNVLVCVRRHVGSRLFVEKVAILRRRWRGEEGGESEKCPEDAGERRESGKAGY